jgi:alpha-tubulin suppressor-like RCC1 family protein
MQSLSAPSYKRRLLYVVHALQNSEAAAGAQHTLILKDDGSVESFGRGDHGRLGRGSLLQQLSPAAVAALGRDNRALGAGATPSFVLKSNGQVSAFGGNAHGQLGDGTTTQVKHHIPCEQRVCIAYCMACMLLT